MKIERISYGKSFENQAGVWEKMGLEAALEPGETPEQAYDQARQIIDGWHGQSNPTYNVREVQKHTPQSIYDAIESCTDLTTLKSFYLMAKQTADTLAAYTKKYSELSNQ
jgi:hypothetical protein